MLLSLHPKGQEAGDRMCPSTAESLRVGSACPCVDLDVLAQEETPRPPAL